MISYAEPVIQSSWWTDKPTIEHTCLFCLFLTQQLHKAQALNRSAIRTNGRNGVFTTKRKFLILIVRKIHLCLPDSLNSLGKTDIVGLEFVKTNADKDGGSLEDPVKGLSDLWYTPAGEIISDACPIASISAVFLVGMCDGIFPYSKPMWEWIRRVAQRSASRVGLREPDAKGAMVNGMRAADINLDVLVSMWFRSPGS